MKSNFEHRSQDERLSLAEVLDQAFGGEAPDFIRTEELRRHLERKERRRQGELD